MAVRTRSDQGKSALPLLTNISQTAPINPRPLLQSLISKPVSVRLKWNDTEYTGILVSVDSYMNMQIQNAEEWISGKSKGHVGTVLVRCNNVLWVGEFKGEIKTKAEAQGVNGKVEEDVKMGS